MRAWPTWRGAPHGRLLRLRAAQDRGRREELPRLHAKGLGETLDGLDLDLRLPAVLELLVEFEFEADRLGHLLLRQVRPQPEVAEIFGKLNGRRHYAC